MWIILDINYNDFYHTGKSQICAGAWYVFRTSKLHSGMLCAAPNTSFFENIREICFIIASYLSLIGFIYEAQMDMIENSGHCSLYVEKFSYFGHHQVPLYHTYVGLDPNTYHPPVPCRVKNALIYPLSSNLKASQCYIKEVWIVTRIPTYHNYFI